jgi:hypothetical protein
MDDDRQLGHRRSEGLTGILVVAGRELLDRLQIPQPWCATVDPLMADRDEQIGSINEQLRQLSPSIATCRC